VTGRGGRTARVMIQWWSDGLAPWAVARIKKYSYRGDGYKCVSFARCFRNYIILYCVLCDARKTTRIMYYIIITASSAEGR